MRGGFAWGFVLAMAAPAAAQNDKTRANSYDDAWETGWVNHGRSVYTTAGKTPGFVLQVGDSITHSNPYSQWPRGGAGQTSEDATILAWCQAAAWNFSSNTDLTIKNGWYLAAADTSGTRGMTSSGGIDTSEYRSGDGNGGAIMPTTTVTATAQGYVTDGTTYPANLQIDTVAAAFADAQFAVLMLGTNDVNAGRSSAAFSSDLAYIVSALEARNIAVVLSTIPPIVGKDVTPYNAAIRSLAQTVGLPLIDYYAEILARQPTNWQNTLISADGVHPSASGGGYTSASDPYTPGGDPATHATGDACLNVGYLLRSWLTVQKLKEVKTYVVDGVNPPSPGPAPSSSSGGGGGGCGATGLEAVLLAIALARLRR